MDTHLLTAACWDSKGSPWNVHAHVVDITGVFQIATKCGYDPQFETKDDGSPGRPAWHMTTANNLRPTCEACRTWCSDNLIILPPYGKDDVSILAPKL